VPALLGGEAAVVVEHAAVAACSLKVVLGAAVEAGTIHDHSYPLSAACLDASGGV
jgi:hypothetical protein